ncbi:post-transcriptional regulator [Oceanobacillus sp. Castelsardo]|uniref:post-transcriptional regulator n=1 Tax=Oceanobacillus sp. Castelsardo TaxID=1851204 RepID=UPI000839289B|nr:post-transcriptional regulator [Oceanobacillus sp. Castelsardo]
MGVLYTVNEWKEQMKPILESKAFEFQSMGYSQVTTEEVWNCLVAKVWKGNPKKRMHEITQDIFHLGSNVYLSYLTVKSYENDDLMASIAALTGATKEK